LQEHRVQIPSTEEIVTPKQIYLTNKYSLSENLCYFGNEVKPTIQGIAPEFSLRKNRGIRTSIDQLDCGKMNTMTKIKNSSFIQHQIH